MQENKKRRKTDLVGKKIFILGLPNTGKSLIFSTLTGEFTIVANSPLTTLTFKRARLETGGQAYQVADTPGIYSLYIASEEQAEVRNAIFNEKPDVIIQCIDANRLKQSLVLTAELLSLRIPMVVSLNAIDETSRRGIWIDSDGLGRSLGVPVVESLAVQARGIRELKTAIQQARVGKRAIPYGDIIEGALSQLSAMMPPSVPHQRAVSLLMLMGDPLIDQYLKDKIGELPVAQLTRAVGTVKGQFKGRITRVIANCRSRWIDDIVTAAIKKQKVTPRDLSNTAARICRHPVWGIPVLFSIIYLMLMLVVNVANVMSETMNNLLWEPVAQGIQAVLPSGFWHDFLIGDYGVLSLGLANALLTVLPILGVFFLLFNILEDVGYIPNLSVLTKRVLGKLGLSGGAIMPLVLGFGCKTMATLTTKTLRSKRERYIAIYLIAFSIPCAAQMGLNMSILGRMGAGAFFIAFSFLTALGTGAGIALNKILKADEKPFLFMQELPAMRLPNPRAVLKKTYYRLYWFLRESLMVFIYAAVALFVMDRLKILDAAKELLSPFIRGLLGLPLDMVDAIILCFARHEAGAGLIIKLIRDGRLDYVQCIVAVVITTTFAPCFANIMAMVKEVGGRRTLVMLAGIGLSAFVSAGALNWVLLTFL